MATGLVDWTLAERLGVTLAGRGSAASWASASPVASASANALAAIVEYTGLDPAGPVPDAESVSRSEWIHANLRSLEAAAAAIERRFTESAHNTGTLGGGARAILARLTAAEAGVVLGYAGRRVLGQYELPLLGPPRPPRLLFVAPNLTETGRELGSEAPLLRWIALHEVTHAVQFGAAPWLRDHLAALITELIESVEPRLDAARMVAGARSALTGDPRRLPAAIRELDPVRALASPQQKQLIDRLQAAMSVVEGYAEHVMDAAGAELDPEVARLREGLEARRRGRGPLETLLARLLGLELKLRQYREGRRFANRVVARGGIVTLNRAWSDPAALPDPDELLDPDAWVRRVAA